MDYGLWIIYFFIFLEKKIDFYFYYFMITLNKYLFIFSKLENDF